MHATSLLPVISVFLATSRSAIAQTCYFPDKTVAERDTPCHTPTGGGASSCCAEGDICLDNNLCMSQTGYLGFSRGTCTDISWQSGNCSQYCADGKSHLNTPLPGSQLRRRSTKNTNFLSLTNCLLHSRHRYGTCNIPHRPQQVLLREFGYQQ